MRTSRSWPLLAALALGLLPVACAPPDTGIDHVLVITVDGLVGDALLAGSDDLPAFARLRRGASTLAALSDADTTLPNHVTMVSGRPAVGPEGHHWTSDAIDARHRVVHAERGEYVASMFDVAHTHGVRTGAFVTSPALNLLRFSWDGTHAPPGKRGRACGRIDDFLDSTEHGGLREPEETVLVTGAALQHLRSSPRTLGLLHYHEPQRAGRDDGWSLSAGSAYRKALASVDHQVGRLLTDIETDPALRSSTVVILTTGHGIDAGPATIPFFVWTAGAATPLDLYRLNVDSRADPAGAAPPPDTPDPAPPRDPIRNGDVANLALHLLGLPPVPGSVFNTRQDLATIWVEGE